MMICQEAFDITPESLPIFEKFISPERLAAYYILARGNRRVGILLYERNTELSEALYGVIQCLEVTLRNAIHNAISEAIGAASWFDKVGLEDSEIAWVEKAVTSIKESNREATPGRVVAELNFGFWVKLLGRKYEKSLWVDYLSPLFPPTVKRPLLYARLLDMKTLRNRIAHHERIVGKRNLLQDYEDLLEAISWLSVEIASWVKFTNCFSERATRKLRVLPKPVVLAAAVPLPKETKDGA